VPSVNITKRIEVFEDPWSGRETFLANLRKVEATTMSLSMAATQPCPVCGENKTVGDVTHGDWNWPKHLIHCIEAHNFQPPQEFIEYINKTAGSTVGDSHAPDLW